jgi:spectinomycin phosphotransferase/16S rRNA (guanine(1405)-N(7))-methyltransferase
VYTRPPTIDDARIVAFVTQWGVAATQVEYRAVGFGSHHWYVESDDARWFLTVDDLRVTRGREHLEAALHTAYELRTSGRDFVVAPIPSERGEIVVALDERYVGALYGFVAGETFPGGEYAHDDERREVLGLLASLHNAPAPASARRGDFVLADRVQLTEDLPWGSGPYAMRARNVLEHRREHVETELARYDHLAALAARHADEFVVTHGEPHAGNTILTPRGRVLIDWDTALVAPRERDLWEFARVGDHPLFADYEAATGAAIHPAFLALYALQYDLMEIGGYLAFFRADHGDTADAAESWKNYLYFIGAG